MSIFQSESMLHISLYLHSQDVEKLAIYLAQSGYFAIDNHFKISEPQSSDKNLSDTTLSDTHLSNLSEELANHNELIDYQHLFSQSKQRWLKITDYLKQVPSKPLTTFDVVSKQQLSDIDRQLEKINEACQQHKEHQHQLQQQFSALNNLFTLLKQFNDLDINLDLFNQNFGFLDLRLGMIPQNYFQRVQKALTLASYSIFTYLKEKDQLHVIIAGEKLQQQQVQSLLDASSFKAIIIPESFAGSPAQMLVKLEMEKQLLLQEQYHLNIEFQNLQKQYKQQLIILGEQLSLAHTFVSLSQNLYKQGFLSQVNGWIPADKLEHFQQYLQKSLSSPIVVESIKPTPENYAKTPSYLIHPGWMKPFENLISNYGVPAYKEFDPSWFFTLSYILMFGFMFGDIGHGVTLILFARLIRKHYPQVVSFFISIGLSSTFFGFMYGSIFSFEHLLTPIWLAPIDHPDLLLTIAFYWGAAFLSFLSLVNIYNQWVRAEFKSAIFSPKASSGLLLYISLLWSLYELYLGSLSSSASLLFIVSLLIIFTYQFKQTKTQNNNISVERVIISLIETYEVIISYISHSLSFLRVAAFALNHSALAIALFTLAAMTEGSWHWFTIIFGNLFILILEGVIVSIQVLRLEYYEGFSRYFGAKGYLFKPMKLSMQQLFNGAHSIKKSNT
ncbi:MAG: hypothetical protein HQL46_01405 [Gammaproteobacteria bacterium]|nr:hypothetical protein [Gammaproteobacteria bacterium]